MDRQTDGRMGGWVDGWMNVWKEGSLISDWRDFVGREPDDSNLL